MGNRQATTIEEMLQKAGGSPELVEAVRKQSSERVLVDHLVSLRGARGFSQEDISKHFNCSQSNISKLENGTDHDLRIGDLIAYSEAIGLELSVALTPSGSTGIDRIKHHAFCIQEELLGMVDMAGKDEDIVNGVARAHQVAL